jgi:L-lactate dehydrogenase (cytochrome)
MAASKISATEVSKHCSENDAWIVVNSVVWDMSGFASKHPGGASVIQKYVGRDGSEAYNAIHGPGLIANYLGTEKRIGEASLEKSCGSPRQVSEPSRPDINSIINLSQFEVVAKEYMTDATWGYVAGATEDGVSHRANLDWYQRILFRPRVLNQVQAVDMSIEVLGQKYSLPFFNAPTSSVKLSHPDGELALARASVAFGVPPIIPTMGSYSVQEIVDVLPAGYPFFFQLYMYADRSETKALLESVCKLKPRGILFTVDLPVMSKREIPTRERHTSEGGPKGRKIALPPNNSAIEENIGWEDVAWLRNHTGVPIFLKGIQCSADARRAFEYGCAGIYISNHGGRAMDTAAPAILVLLEIHASCPEILSKMEIFIDGGIRRGRDILKAICLGASAVGIGRPFLYSLQYGEDGANKAFKSTSES